MKKFNKSGMAILALLIFASAIVSSAFGQIPQSEEKGLKLLEEGESLFKSFKYEEALEKYREAFSYLKSKDSLVRFYLNISQAYYALGDEANTKIMLKKMFELESGKDIDREKYPKGFVKIYLDAKIEFSSESAKPGAVGQEGTGQAKKKLPLPLIIGIAVVVGAVLAYFLFFKKSDNVEEKFTLTVTKGTGVIGSPDSGSYTYVKGAIASYDYGLDFDYLFYDLVVKIDGAAASAKGNITMDKNHTLNASVLGWATKK